MIRWPFALPLALLAVAAGCSKLPRGASLLPAAPALDHVALELFFVRFPLEEQSASTALWSSVDEQTIDLDVRRRLSAAGLAVGQVGGQLPPALVELLHVSDDAPLPTANQVAVVDSSKPPVVHRKLIDVYQIETPSRIVVTGDRERHPKLTVLLRDESDAVRGWTFRNAQGTLVTKVVPEPDGRVKLDIAPEVEYGEARQQIMPGEGGAWTMQIVPPRKTFDSLRFTATMSPGEVLIVGRRGDQPGSLGHQFFTDSRSDVPTQIVLLIRVMKGKADDLFVNQGSDAE
ncbi:MAG TPA: hypothetical protein VHC22_04160 [Pirellulales bacterium]|nr:hypothetical protein [Pirellulales bacterium]